MKVKGLGYQVYYSYKLTRKKGGVVNKELIRGEEYLNSAYVCFSELYNEALNGYDSNGHIKIKICITDKENAARFDNYCLITKEQVKEYLGLLTHISMGYWTFLCEDYDDDYILITCTTNKDVNFYQVRLIPAMIRVLFEKNYNYVIKLAFLMSKEVDFMDLDLAQRFTLALNCFINDNGGHSIHSNYYEFVSTDIFDNDSLQSRFDYAISELMNVNQFISSQKDKKLPIQISPGSAEEVIESLEKNEINEKLKKTLFEHARFKGLCD